jgi:hypothetical protein
MEKRRTLTIVAHFSVLIIFILALILLIQNPQLTGYITFESQPDSAEGKDSYIRNETSSNFGAATTLKIGKTAAGQEMRALLEFNVSSIPSENTVTSAVIQVYLALSSNENSTTILVKRVTREWNESELTWGNRKDATPWFNPGADYDSTTYDSVVLTNQTGYYNFTITTLVQEWIDGTYDNYGIILIAQSPQDNEIKEISSSDYGTSSQRPMIIIEHQLNAPPEIVNISTNSDLPNPKKPGENVTISVNWSDLDSSETRIFVCNSTDISVNGCGGGHLCNTTLSSNNPSSCSYTISETDNRTETFYVKACDANNCSEANESFFMMNHLPSIIIEQPNGGETLNQSQGSYSVEFTASDSDSDSLFANLYYGETPNSTNYTIADNINLSVYCSDTDSDTSTPNACTYPWDTSGIFGTFYMTIIINDTYHISNDTSDDTFDVVSLEDTINPNITAQWIESGRIFSGKTHQIYANASDENIYLVWAELNYSSQNLTMYNETSETYNVTFTAPAVGTYQFRVYAQDIIGNINNSMPWTEFTVEKPITSSQLISTTSTALPFSTIKVSAEINNSDSLNELYAYLNVPSGFTFQSNYPQNNYSGNSSYNESKTIDWFLSTPLSESSYQLNVTFTDQYSNTWETNNTNIIVTSSVGSGYSIEMTGYPEVETNSEYFVKSFFKSAGLLTDPDSIYISIYDSLGSLVVGPAAMSQVITGEYNYSYTVGTSANEGQWETIINATQSSTSYFVHEFWKVIGGPFDLRDIEIIDSSIDNLTIQVTAENTGGANKDLITVWNLTREDTSASLDSGSDTFLVPANSEVNYTITPSTSYVGQVRVTFLGTYSGTEKIGAYEIFSTTSGEGGSSEPPSETGGSSGGGGGGGADAPSTNETQEKTTSNLEINSFEEKIYLSKDVEKKVTLEIENKGSEKITGINILLVDIPSSYYKIENEISDLDPYEKHFYEISFNIPDIFIEKEFYYEIEFSSGSLSKKGTLTMVTIKEFILIELQKLKERSEKLQREVTDEGILEKLDSCDNIILEIEEDTGSESFIEARDKFFYCYHC